MGKTGCALQDSNDPYIGPSASLSTPRLFEAIDAPAALALFLEEISSTKDSMFVPDLSREFPEDLNWNAHSLVHQDAVEWQRRVSLHINYRGHRQYIMNVFGVRPLASWRHSIRSGGGDISIRLRFHPFMQPRRLFSFCKSAIFTLISLELSKFRRCVFDSSSCCWISDEGEILFDEERPSRLFDNGGKISLGS